MFSESIEKSYMDILRSIDEWQKAMDEAYGQITALLNNIGLQLPICGSFFQKRPQPRDFDVLTHTQRDLAQLRQASEKSREDVLSSLHSLSRPSHGGGSRQFMMEPDQLEAAADRCNQSAADVRNMVLPVTKAVEQLDIRTPALRDAYVLLQKLESISRSIAAQYETMAQALQEESRSLASFDSGPWDASDLWDTSDNSADDSYTPGSKKDECSASPNVTGNPETKKADDAKTPELKKVKFSAIAPRQIAKGENALINIIMYEDAFRSAVDEYLAAAEAPQRETKSGVVRVKDEAMVRIELTSRDVTIEDGELTQQWQGEYLDFYFSLFIPEAYEKRQALLNASVYINDLLATRLLFTVDCASQSASPQSLRVERKDVLSAFISYASQDRSRVAAIIQGMRKVLPDIDIFFDVESLRSGDAWENALHTEIDARDILFLFWSRHARDSRWVEAEWRYALRQKGIQGIDPVPIEPPDICPPPEELKGKHFNDKLLYIIGSEES